MFKNSFAHALGVTQQDGNPEAPMTKMAAAKEQCHMIGRAKPRPRAHSSAADLMMKSYSKPVQREGPGVVNGRSSFDAVVHNLLDDKYNREYKLDKKTREKAFEIITDYYAKHQDEAANVSELSMFEFSLQSTG